MSQSEERAELTIWADRDSKKNGCPPIVKRGSWNQVLKFAIERDIDRDFTKFFRKWGRK